MRSRTIALVLVGGVATVFTAAATPAQTPATQPHSTAATHPAENNKSHGPPMHAHPSFENGGRPGRHSDDPSDQHRDGPDSPRWGGRGERPPMEDHFRPPMRGPAHDREDEYAESRKSSRQHDDDDVEELTQQVRKLRKQISELQDTVDEMSHQLKRHERTEEDGDRHAHRHGRDD